MTSTLVKTHIFLTVAHLAQSITQFSLAATRTPVNVPVTRTAINITTGVPPWSPLSSLSIVYYSPIQPMYLMPIFLLLTSLAHVATAVGYYMDWIWTFSDDVKTFNKDGKKFIKSSTLRWSEYSVTSSLMILALMLISVILEIYSLILGSICNYCMILFGYFSDEFRFLSMSGANVGNNVGASWAAGCIAGFGPWIVIWLSLVSSGLPFDSTVGAIVYSSTSVTMFFFFSFAMVSFNYSIYEFCYCCGRSILKGKKYALVDAKNAPMISINGSREEFIYPLLSATSKTLLAWLVFGALIQAN